MIVLGKDASEAFEDVGHSTDARGMLTQYYIGDIAEVRIIHVYIALMEGN